MIHTLAYIGRHGGAALAAYHEAIGGAFYVGEFQPNFSPAGFALRDSIVCPVQ